MNRPQFSIVIPTRQRHQTLGYAIQSVLFQDWPDYEVVVMDNCSSPETWDVVKQFRSPRLKYERAPRVLPMNENWELGLDRTEGEYVFFMGDDDAVMPDGLRLAANILARAPFDVLSWLKYTYWWDSAIEPTVRGRLFVHYGCQFHQVDRMATIQNFYDWRTGMNRLPSIYTALVKRTLIEKVRAQTGGKYFALGAPDVYTGLANAWFGDLIGFFERGLSIGGNSGFSTGTAWYFRSKGQARRDAYHADEGKDESQLMHPALIPSVNLEVNLADTLLRTRELLFPDEPRFQVNIPLVLAAMAANMNRDPESYDVVVGEIRALAAKYSLDPGTVALPPRAPVQRATSQGLMYGAGQSVEGLAVNCPEAGVHDVAQAARLAAAVLPVLTIQ
ncbi:MAG: glycosyltransferase family 2 protein [Bryobacterales bacterium]|nr:glycosyltransferase family 2 protein [Bryobacterales bacterium]